MEQTLLGNVGDGFGQIGVLADTFDQKEDLGRLRWTGLAKRLEISSLENIRSSVILRVRRSWNE